MSTIINMHMLMYMSMDMDMDMDLGLRSSLIRCGSHPTRTDPLSGFHDSSAHRSLAADAPMPRRESTRAGAAYSYAGDA